MIRKHVAPVRLIDLLELTEEDFYFAFPALTEPSDGE